MGHALHENCSRSSSETSDAICDHYFVLPEERQMNYGKESLILSNSAFQKSVLTTTFCDFLRMFEGLLANRKQILVLLW